MLVADVDTWFVDTQRHSLAFLLFVHDPAVGVSSHDLGRVRAKSKTKSHVELIDSTEQCNDTIAEKIIKRVLNVYELLHNRNYESHV